MKLDRRALLGAATAAALSSRASAEATAETAGAPTAPSPITTLDLRRYLLSQSPWVDPKKTVDTVKIGDPTRPVRKAGVCWYPSIWDIRAAHKAGCDLLITHEPTFWTHADPERNWFGQEPDTTKRRFLEETGLVILRCHDCWDNWPGIGIRDSWAAALGLTQHLRDGSSLLWHGLYEIPEQPLRDFARHIAARIRPFGEDSVQVIGDPDRRVSRPSLGVGCAVPDKEMVDFGADVLIMCYDGASYWAARERLAEMGVALITVEHGTSEMPGIENLCKHLAERFPGIEFLYLAEHPRTWTVRA